ncbi:MAG TPA: hypothetical protein VFV67_12530 [Actinophytocola sp.]|uniref:hypothetical protein n=1 Tax=Actinophytocola sp. TaxID=1872138 RepID=UPI002DB809AD|nr:hypothetical protein [Actinophytocola sp.]HEU5471472.1 hypothetical protein [Actinophytocola sp.]
MRVRGVLQRMVDRWEERGVYVPGEDNRVVSPLRDFGWLLAGWCLAVALFVTFFVLAG